MRWRWTHIHRELGLLILMTLLSLGLATIQYHWTGELSQTEASRLRENMREQLRQISRAFNAEVTENCRALTPSLHEIETRGPERAFAERYWLWEGREHRPLFSRAGIAFRDGIGTKTMFLNPALMRMALWAEPAGQPGPLVHVPAPGTAGIETVFEIDLKYLRQTWLPELTRAWLSPTDGGCRVRIRTTTAPRATIYDSAPGDTRISAKPDATSEMFSVRGSTEGEHQWTIDVWRLDRSIDAAVSASRWRNFAVAGLLIVLILGEGSALLSYTNRSRRLAEMQMTFIAGVSHELKTPLAVIRGAGHNLAEGVVQEDQPVRTYGAMIRRNADLLAETVDQVLTFARSGAVPRGAFEPLSVAALIHDAVEATTLEVRESGCAVDIDLPAELPNVRGDRFALRRAVQNLVSNAVRHGGSGGWVGISARSGGLNGRGTVEVRVEDRGPGIPEKEMRRIFDPFFRGERARAGQVRGFGLGLSLVRDIARAHSGEISVQRSAGGGAEFRLQLPAMTE